VDATYEILNTPPLILVNGVYIASRPVDHDPYSYWLAV